MASVHCTKLHGVCRQGAQKLPAWRCEMGFSRVAGVAWVALLLCAVVSATLTASGAGGERPLDMGAGASGSEEFSIGAAELAAVPAESRALFAKLLGRLDDMRGEMEELRAGRQRADARAEHLNARVSKLEESCEDQEKKGEAEMLSPGLIVQRTEGRQSERRQTQGAEPEPEPELPVGDLVKIIKPQTVRCGGPGGTTANGAFDSGLCESDPTFAACHAAACDGHKGRRQLQGDGYSGSSCTATELPARSAAVTAGCCDEQTEDCTGGHPHSCNADCAALFLPFWADCRAALGTDSRQLEPVVALCESTVLRGAPSLAEQLNLQCTDGSAVEDCVPHCSERYHGFLMLLNIDGNDSKLSCELHRGLYSWVGSSVRAPRLPSCR
eukprot:COSAG03_NODE_941_length_5251_cov_254.015334_5_plen_384_part_00